MFHGELTCQDRGQLKSGPNIFYCLKCIEIFEADHELCRKRCLRTAVLFVTAHLEYFNVSIIQ